MKTTSGAYAATRITGVAAAAVLVPAFLLGASGELLAQGQSMARDVVGGTNVLERPALLHVTDVPLRDALIRLGEHSGVRIAFSPSLLSDVDVSCACDSLSVGAALSRLLAGTPFHYTRFRDQILIERTSAGDIEGRVVAAATRAGVEGAEVRIVGSELRAFTSATGEFVLRGVPEGTHRLEARVLGYHAVSRSVRVASGEKARVEFELQPAAIAVERVTVAAQRTRTATKTNEPLLLIPQAVTVVPEVIVEQQQAQELSQVLRNVSGVSHTGTFQGVAADFHIRGFLAGPLGNYRRNGTEVFGRGDMMNANVESVEVLKGPASVLYGSVEPGGVINVVTKQPLADAAYQADLRVDNHGLINPRVDLTGPLNQSASVLYRLNASWEQSDSYRDVIARDGFFVAPVLSFRPTQATTWTVEAEAKHEDRTTDPGIGGVRDSWESVDDVPIRTYLGEADAASRWRHYAGLSTVEHRISGDWQLRNVLQLASYRTDEYLLVLGARNGDDAVNRAAYFESQRYRYGFAEVNVQGALRSGPLRHRLVLGGDYQRLGADLGSDAGSADPISLTNPVRTGAPPRSALEPVWRADQTNHTIGVFLQDQIEVSDYLQVLAGVRYTHLVQYSTDLLADEGEDRFEEGVATPRIGALLRPSADVSVYGTFSRSFVPYYGFDTEGRPFRPVTGEQLEAGVKATFFGGGLAAGLTGYRLTRSNAVSFMFNSEFGFHGVQGARHRSTGLELDVLGRPTPEWTVMGSYSYIDGRIVEDPNYESGRRLSGAPPHSGSIWTSYELASGPGLGVGVFYTGERRTLNSSRVVTPGYTTVDVSATYRLGRRYQARLNLRNALNERYYTGAQSYTLVFPGAPRTLQASFSGSF